MCIIRKANCIFRAGRRNARRDIRSVTHRIPIPMQARTQWTHTDVFSQLATTPEWSFKIGDRQNAKRQWNSDRRAIYNATRCFDAGRGVIRHRGVSDGSYGARPVWRSHSARTEYFFADAPAKPDPLVHTMPDQLLQVKPDPPLAACSQWVLIIREASVTMSEQRDQAWAYQSCGSKGRTNATSLVHVKPDPKLIASS